MAQAALDIDDTRSAAVAACVDAIRDDLADGVTRERLETVKRRLIELAGRTDLFSYAQFPVQDGDGSSSLYLLSEDDDHGYALFAVAERKGNMSPPHDHTTWAVIVGIEGEEVNRFYERLDDGSRPGHAQVRETGEQAVVEAGSGVAFLDDDIHSIHCVTDTPTLNFHMYGTSIEHLPERKMFNMKDGTYKHFPPNPSIHK